MIRYHSNVSLNSQIREIRVPGFHRRRIQTPKRAIYGNLCLIHGLHHEMEIVILRDSCQILARPRKPLHNDNNDPVLPLRILLYISTNGMNASRNFLVAAPSEWVLTLCNEAEYSLYDNFPEAYLEKRVPSRVGRLGMISRIIWMEHNKQ